MANRGASSGRRGAMRSSARIRKPALPDRPNLAFMHCDVTDLTTLAEIVTRFGVRRIVHTAAMVSTASARILPVGCMSM